MILDPWDDAEELARRLAVPDTPLVIVIGAQAWCAKCRNLRPAFDALDAQQGFRILLWLDVDDHEPFLGNYLPDDLPELLVCQNGLVLYRGVVGNDARSLHEEIEQACKVPRGAPDATGIFRRLVATDWAKT